MSDTAAICRVVGMEAMEKRLAKMDHELKHKQAAYAQAVVQVDKWVQDNFRSQGGSVGGWAPLKNSTIAARAMQKDKTRKKLIKLRGASSDSAKLTGWLSLAAGMRILQNNGQLKTRWKHFSTDDSGKLGSEATLASGVFYGIYHESDKPRKKLPRRRLLPTQKEMWPKIKVIFERHIKKALHD